MTFSRRAITAATGCAAMLVMSVLPASAATTVVHDPRGDTLSPSADPPPDAGYDLTRIMFRNGPHRVAVKAHVFGLHLEPAAFILTLGPVSSSRRFFARTFLGREGERRTPQNVLVQPNAAPTRLPCRVRAAWRPVRTNTVSLSIPQSCLRAAAGPLRMRVVILKTRGTEIGDASRWIRLQRG